MPDAVPPPLPESPSTPADARLRLRTVGHGTLDADAFASLVRGAGIRTVVDVRSYPGSRRVPHFGRDVMAEWLPDAGVAYRWEPRLGGRRRTTRDSPNTALTHPAFRAYADHMAGAEFAAGLATLMDEAEDEAEDAEASAAADTPDRIAVMCSESVWWRCHRRMIADAAVLLHGAQVQHLFHDGRLAPHPVWDVARVEAGRVLYDGGRPGLPLRS